MVVLCLSYRLLLIVGISCSRPFNLNIIQNSQPKRKEIEVRVGSNGEVKGSKRVRRRVYRFIKREDNLKCQLH